MNAPRTAAARTRMVTDALREAGYLARVTSRPASHKAQVSTITQCPMLDDALAYLTGYLGDLATVRRNNTFATVAWRSEHPEC